MTYDISKVTVTMSDKEHKWHDLPGYTNYVTETEKHTENTNDMTENTIAYT